MPATEKDLAEDAPWKKIQQNTFTRWCNEHLKCINKSITDLQKDFGDGLKLIGLLEVLSQKKMYRKHHNRPNFRQMKLENVSVALEFLDREHIRLVSIDSNAIVDRNLKLILGLIWTLILHYSISMPIWEDEDDEEAKELTPKQRLLGWLQNKVPELPINNFHRDWRDGKALGALVDNCAPGLCPDWQAWDPYQPVENAREAMQQADDWLGVPQVINPEEIVDPEVDEQSVMTYLSQFPKSKLKPGAPLKPKGVQLYPKKAKSYGPGIEPNGNMVLKPAVFTVETLEAGQAEVLVYVTDPEGHTEEAKVVFNNDKNRTYTVIYIPKVEGAHKVKVLFAGQDINKSPYTVNVAKAIGDPNRVQARGPGLEATGNMANKPTYFDIYTAGAGNGDVSVVIVDPEGKKDTVKLILENKGDSVFRCTYQPMLEGPHTIHILFACQEILKSPFKVQISEAINAGTCRATGRGLQPKGVRVKEVADFKVFTKGAGSGELKVSVTGPYGDEEPVKVKDIGDGVYECEYLPNQTGKCTVNITWGGQPIPHSPFDVEVSEVAGPQKVRAWGPGLVTGRVGKSADFVVEAIGTEVGTLGFSIEGPSQAKIECDDKGDGSCDVRYWPTEPDDYAVHVICDDEDIKDSPFMAHILSATNDCFPEKVKAFGPGLETIGVIVNKPAEFTIDARGAGNGHLKIYAKDTEGVTIGIKITDKGDGTFLCVYVPIKPIKHTIIITWGDVNVPNSPFRVIVGEGCHPDKVKVNGPGVEKTGLKANEPTYFTVDCAAAGQGDISIGIKCAPGVVGPAEADIDFDFIKNDNDTFTVKYTPPGAGKYTIMVLFAEQEIPISPFRVKVDPSHDAGKVRAEGPGLNKTGVEVGTPTHFTIFTKGAGKAKPKVQFTAVELKGEAVRDFEIIDNHDYSYTVKYTAVQQGQMTISVTHGGDSIPKSPFNITVAPPVDLGKVKVTGLDTKVEVGKDQEFYINTQGAGGQGEVAVKMTSPSGRPIPYTLDSDTANGAHSVKYIPPEEGPYKVDVSYDVNPVPGSPFAVEGVMPADSSKVRAYGPGLKGGIVGKPAPFAIDTNGVGTGGLGLTVEGPCKAKIECQDNGLGTCSVSYLPTEAGEYAINILFGEQHIPGSPFKAAVKPCLDPSKVTASGPGLDKAKAGEPAYFTVDCTSAGEAELTIKIVSESRAQAEVHIQKTAEGTFSVTYIPPFHGTHTITIKYGGHVVPKFPALIQVEPAVDTSGVQVYGPGVQPRGVIKEVTTHFIVDARKMTKTFGDHLKACIINPSGTNTDTYITDKGDGTFRVEYTAYEDGMHVIEVLYAEVAIPKSPFSVSVVEGCDPTRVRAYGPGLEGGLINKPNCFTVETRGAGTGSLGLTIEGASEAKITCKDNKDGSCSVEYVTFTPGEYDVSINFGGHPVPGSPFRLRVRDVVDPSKVKCSGPGLGDGVRAHVPQTFTVDATQAGQAQLKVCLTRPSGSEPVAVKNNSDGTHTVNYTPVHDGPYTVSVKYGDQEVPRSPFKVRSQPGHDASKVCASGPGLDKSGVPASLPVEFTIDARDAGEGLLTEQILDPEGKPKNATIYDNRDGSYSVSYVPDSTGPYAIIIKYGGDEIPYSPYHISALPTGDASKCLLTVSIGGHALASGLTKMQVHEEAIVSVDAKAAGKGKVTCSVTTPEGVELDMDVQENRDGTFAIYFTAPEPGKYVITIRFGGQHIPKSPFHVTVEYILATKEPVVPSDGMDQFRPLNLVIPTWSSHSQQGPITGEVRMPSGKTARPYITDNKDGTITVKFNPTEKSLHEMDIKYEGSHIPGSPLQFYVNAMNSGLVTAYGPGLCHGTINKPVTFTVVTKNAGEGGLSLAVEGPSKAEITCKDNKDGTCTVSYLPTLPGDYKIIVKFDNKHIPGSPFTAKVTGDDSIWTSQLNVGTAADGPCKAEISFEDRKDGSCGVVYIVQDPGDYEVSIKFNNEHIPDSPFVVPIAMLSDEACRLTVTSLQEKDLKVNQEASFAVQCNGARGVVDAKVHTPSGSAEECYITELDSDKNAICFIPRENGVHSIDVKFNGSHIPGSPFNVRVGEAGQAGDPGMVTVYGPGLDGGSTGVASEFVVNTGNAGSGALSVNIDGPSKVKMDCSDCPDGYKVIYTPMAPGNYLITIKYGGPNHIVGSPFKAKVTGTRLSGGHSLHETSSVLVETVTKTSKVAGAYSTSSSSKLTSDASKVVCRGGGLTKALVGQKNLFNVDCSKAGTNMLLVGVHGPRTPSEEVDVKHMGNRLYNVTYTVKDKGNYTVIVKWGDDSVPGSPFKVAVP
uniref:Filamin C n=1 Tax=Hucho hucho TaxID=62062 RepID=A0A4W5PNZ1_9TELE